MKILVWDVDGTLANIEHRRHHVRGEGKKNWAAFNREMSNDTPHDDIIWLFQTLSMQVDVMVIASGRGEEDREKTEAWLRKHGMWSRKEYLSSDYDDELVISGPVYVYDKLYMRPAKDSRKDSIIKKEILDQIIAEYGEKPFMVFDDRNQVVDMWRENGIRCLQVAPGDF